VSRFYFFEEGFAMAAKKKTGKKLGKKDMKKTKGGILVSSYNPALKIESSQLKVNPTIQIDQSGIGGIFVK
jgi:hypothetical protein